MSTRRPGPNRNGRKLLRQLVQFACEKLEQRMLLSGSGLTTTTGGFDSSGNPLPWAEQTYTSAHTSHNDYYNAHLFETRNTNDPVVSQCPIRYYDGLPKFDSVDFMSNAFGHPFGQVRSWAARDGVTSNINGTNWAASQLTRIFEATNTSVVVLDTGLVQRWFDYNQPTDSFIPRLEVTDALKHVEPDGHEDSNSYYRLENTDGTVMRFHDFQYDTTNPSLNGQLIDETSPGGMVLSVSYNANDQVASVTRTDGKLFEEFDYTYIASNALKDDNVTPNPLDPWRIGEVDWRQNGALIKKAVYTYYVLQPGGSLDPNGRPGDLKYAKIYNGAGNTLETETKYYQYWLYDPTPASEPSHQDGLKYSFEGASFDRLQKDVPNYGDPNSSNYPNIANPDVAPYADHYFEYQCYDNPPENISRFRVVREDTQGATGTPAGTSLDTMIYKYSSLNPFWQYQPGNVQYNTWKQRTTEILPGTTPYDPNNPNALADNSRIITFTNEVADTMVKAYSVPDASTNVTISNFSSSEIGSSNLWMVTVTTASNNVFQTGDRVLLSNIDTSAQEGLEDVYTITRTAANQFTCTMLSVGAPQVTDGGIAVRVSQSIDFYEYNNHGQVILHAKPSAVLGYDETLASGDLLNNSGQYTSTPNYQYLANTTGEIEINDYYNVGWQFANGNAGITANGVNTSALGNTGSNPPYVPSAPQGAQAGFLGTSATMSQRFTLSASTTLNISLQAAQAYGTLGFQVAIDSTVFNFAGGSTIQPGSSYSTYNSTTGIPLAAGSHTLTFTGSTQAGVVLLDNISLTGTGAPSLADAGFESPTLAYGTFEVRPVGSTGTSTTPGGTNVYLQDTAVERGQQASGGVDMLEQFGYLSHGDSNGAVVYPVGTDTVYRTAPQNDPSTTSYSYGWYSNGCGVTNAESQMTITPPTVSAVNNGPGTAAPITKYFNTNGQITFTKDGDGYVSFSTPDSKSSGMLRTIQDADTTSKQVDTYVVGGVANGLTYSLVARSADGLPVKTISYVATPGDTATTVANQLVSLWNASMGANPNTTGLATASTPTGGTIQLAANTAGISFYVAATATSPGTISRTSTASDFSVPVRQQDEFVPGGVQTGVQYTLTVTSADGTASTQVSYMAASGDGVSQVAGQLAGLWNGSQNSLLTGTTAVNTGTAVLLQGKNSGVPLYVTATASGTGTFIRQAHIPAFADTAVPSGLTSPSGTRLRLITTMEVDPIGRTTTLTDPDGNVTYTVYKDTNHEVRTYPGWNSVTNLPTGPTQVVREDWGNKYEDTLTMTAAPHLTNGVPDGTEMWSNLQTLTRDHLNDGGEAIFSDRYFNFAGVTYSTSGVSPPDLGTSGTNYYRTETEYANDDHEVERSVSPTGTITRTSFDPMTRPSGTWVGTADIVSERFDFGPANSPVTDGYMQATDAGYSQSLGYGWVLGGGPVQAVDTGNGNNLTRDYVETNGTATFQVAVPAAGLYLVTIVSENVGTGNNHQLFTGQDGSGSNKVSTDVYYSEPGDVKTRMLVVTVGSDKLLDVVVSDQTGTDAAIAALDVQSAVWMAPPPPNTSPYPTADASWVNSNLTQIGAQQFDNGTGGDGDLTATVSYPGETIDTTTTAATFLGSDTTSQGTWKGNVGLDGAAIDAHTQAVPSYAQMSVSGSSDQIWSTYINPNMSSDAKGLQRTDMLGRIATAYSSPSTFTIDLNLLDGKLHRIGCYFVDYDNSGRSETVSILRASDNSVLDTRTLSGFQNGTWLAWNIRGHVKIQVTATGTGSAVLSGVFFDPANARVTRDYFDWRNRLVAIKSAQQGTVGESTSVHRDLTYRELNNQGQVTAQSHYNGDAVQVVDANNDGIPDAPPVANRTSRVEFSYDEQLRVSETRQDDINQSTGQIITDTTSSANALVLKSDLWYDNRGDLLKDQEPGQPVVKYQYDGAGRQTVKYQSDGGGDSTWADAGNVTGDLVLSQIETQHDPSGNVIFTVDRERFHNTTATGPLGTPTSTGSTPPARVSFKGSWFDAANRIVNSADWGTGGGSPPAVDGNGNPIRPTTVPSRSDTALVTSDSYVADEVQVVTVVNGVSGDTFTLTFTNNGTPATTGNIAYNATAAAVQSALQGLSNIGTGNVIVIGGYDSNTGASTYTVRFVGTLGGMNLAPMTTTANGLHISASVNTNSKGGDSGELAVETDPRGIVTKTDYNPAGQRVRTTAAYLSFVPSSTNDQITEYTYDGDDNVLTSKAVLQNNTFQTTQYVYGVTTNSQTIDGVSRPGSSLNSNDLLFIVHYPNATTGEPGRTAADDQSYAYDGLGEKTSYMDQNQSTHTYSYDLMGSLTLDSIAVASQNPYHVDTLIQSIGYTFDNAHRPFQQTTYRNPNGTTVFNQVQDAYNGFGQLVTEWQNHIGAVNTQTSPNVQYVYDETNNGTANDSRLRAIIYPNGRVLDYTYGTQEPITALTAASGVVTATYASTFSVSVNDQVVIAGASPAQFNGVFTVTSVNAASHQFTYNLPSNFSNYSGTASGSDIAVLKPSLDTLDNGVSRVVSLQDHLGTNAGTNLESYTYLGANTIVQRTEGDGVSLTYIQSGGSGDGGDQYVGLDRFGRIVDQRWTNGTSDLDRFQYAYDRSSDALYKNNLVNSNFSELYSPCNGTIANSRYDALGRIQGFLRGVLYASGNNGTQLDSVNSNSRNLAFTLDPLGNWTGESGSINQTRSLNDKNQITSITNTTATPTYDANGNTTKDENGVTYTYDAWNRMTGANAGGSNFEFFLYDADNRRPAVQICSVGTIDSYYSMDWQVLQENGPTGAVKTQNVWGVGYVDDLVERDDNSSTGNLGINGSGLGQRIYVQHDANWNVTALFNSNGVGLQRFVYDPYGAATVLNPTTWSTTSDNYNWAYRFQSGRYDSISGLVNFRNRDESVTLGRAMEQDNSYIDGLNLYQFEGSNPVVRLDPLGREFTLQGLGVATAIGASIGGLEGGIVGGAFQGKTGGDLALSIVGGMASGAVLGAFGYVGGSIAGGSLLTGVLANGAARIASGIFATSIGGALGETLGDAIRQAGATSPFSWSELGRSALIGAVTGALAGPFSAAGGILGNSEEGFAAFLTKLAPRFEQGLVRLDVAKPQAELAAQYLVRALKDNRELFSVLVDSSGDAFAHLFQGAAECSK